MPSSPEVSQCAFCPHDGPIVENSITSRAFARRRLPDRAGPSSLRLIISSFFLLALITANAPIATAQSPTATLTGTVTDQNEAVVPGVSIAVINIAQGFQRSAVTDGNGIYIVPLLPPGNYTVKAEREGFTPAEVREVVLNVYDRVTLPIQLRVAGVTQNVHIVDRPALIDESPAVATTVDRQFVENLPLNGRSFQSLIGLSPGVVFTKADFNEAGQFSVNGQRANANYFTVDGVSANIGAPTGLVPGQNGAGALPGLTTFGGTNNLVSVDALQEFKILTSTYAPEYGRTPGAQVSLVTRAGTNDFHGTLFHYFRNDVLDANDWFANSRRLKRPALRQNYFGGTLGGPIVLPRFGEGGSQPGYDGRNRTFFFFSYEGLRLRQPLVGITDVPSRSARATATASPAILQILNAFPMPTGPDRANGFAEFAASFSNPTTLNATSLRIDHTVNSKITFFGRINHAPSETATRSGDNGLRSLNNLRSQRADTRTFTAAATWLPNPIATNDFRFNYSRNTNEGVFALDDFGGAVVPPDSLLFPSFSSRETDAVNLSLSGGRLASFWVGNANANVQRQINIVDNLSLVSGSHQLKFGADYRRLSPILSPRTYAQFVTFNGITNSVNGALSGRAQTLTLESNTGPQVPIITNFSLYAQDAWKTTPKLTVTYGVRWEVNPAPHEANDRHSYAINDDLRPANITFAPRGTPLWETTFGNFAPRLGVAYQAATSPGRELVIRGGFGVFYDLGTGTSINSYVGEWPFTARSSASNVPFPIQPATAAPPIIRTAPPTTSVVVLYDPHLKLPYTLQWNLGIDQALGNHQTLSVAYVAAAGRRLLRQETIRFGSSTTFVNPNFAFSALLSTNTASSDYRALQIQFERRLFRGLQALASYTWGRSVDTASNDSGDLNTPNSLVDVNSDRGPSDFDVRHSASAAVTYNLPSPDVGAIGKSILSNWGIDTIFSARSATPLNVTMTMLTTTFGFYSFRPDVISGVPLYLSDPVLPGGRRINPAAFDVPTLGRNGNFPRNSLRGFPFWQIDFSLRRQFNLSERLKLQFRADAFNLLNRPNFGDPITSDLSAGFYLQAANLFIPPAATFGTSTNMLGRRLGAGGNAGGFSPLFQIGGPRSIQLSMRLSF